MWKEFIIINVCSVYVSSTKQLKCILRPTCGQQAQHLRVMLVQWNPSKMDTIGEVTLVLYKEVSFIQGFLNYDIN